MDLVAFALAAILSVGPKDVVARPELDDLAPRLAEDIVTAARFGPLPFGGPAAPEASVLALVVIADHEGAHFDRRVLTCARTADQGKTVSLFGLMKGASWRGVAREELCAGGPLPAYMALLTLAGYAQRCHIGGAGSWFRGYASGSCSVKSDAAAEMCGRWARMAGRMGLCGATCSSAKPISTCGG